MNQSDTDANTKAVDSLLNFETVKYFNNEKHETRRYDVSMEKYSNASIQSQISLSILNTGQAAIMARRAWASVMVLAALMVKSGEVTAGPVRRRQPILIQLYQPLNLLGTVYREITQGLVDMEAMFRLLQPAAGSAGQARRQAAGRVAAARSASTMWCSPMIPSASC